MYIHQLANWPNFTWETDALLTKLGEVRHRQGNILGLMSQAGFSTQETALVDTLTLDVTKSSEIEGESLNDQQVRSSIARRLGIEIAGTIPSERDVDGVVEMMLDATQDYTEKLSQERLFGWHAALFPTGRSGLQKITVGAWRTPEAGSMQVVSGAMGKETIHFEASKSENVAKEMETFINWFNAPAETDPVLKAGIAHLWFVTVHPFDDGNGRITRALTDLLLARADGSRKRFYSMSARILKEKSSYYDMLAYAQKGGLDITSWLRWFLDCLFAAMEDSEHTLESVNVRNKFWETHRETIFNERQQKTIHLLLDDFFGNLTSTKWAKINKVSSDTALRDIQDLLAKGVLERNEGAGKNTTYGLVV